jgi:hypothetical protein
MVWRNLISAKSKIIVDKPLKVCYNRFIKRKEMIQMVRKLDENASMSEKLLMISKTARGESTRLARGRYSNGSYSGSSGSSAKWTLDDIADLLVDLAHECMESEAKAKAQAEILTRIKITIE